MARRKRKRKKRIFPKIAGLVLILALAGGAALSAQRFWPRFLQTAEETAGQVSEQVLEQVSEQQTEFPELTIQEEETADGFYYQQLTEREQTIYREILQGVNSM